MDKKQMLTKKDKKGMFVRFALLALVITVFLAFTASANMLPVSAKIDIDTGSLDEVVELVVDIVALAAKYIGIIIIVWGIFQIVQAFKREDAEGISKQITTCVVGAVLIAFGTFADTLYDKLK